MADKKEENEQQKPKPLSIFDTEQKLHDPDIWERLGHLFHSLPIGGIALEHWMEKKHHQHEERLRSKTDSYTGRETKTYSTDEIRHLDETTKQVNLHLNEVRRTLDSLENEIGKAEHKPDKKEGVRTDNMKEEKDYER